MFYIFVFVIKNVSFFKWKMIKIYILIIDSFSQSIKSKKNKKIYSIDVI